MTRATRLWADNLARRIARKWDVSNLEDDNPVTSLDSTAPLRGEDGRDAYPLSFEASQTFGYIRQLGDCRKCRGPSRAAKVWNGYQVDVRGDASVHVGS